MRKLSKGEDDNETSENAPLQSLVDSSESFGSKNVY